MKRITLPIVALTLAIGLVAPTAAVAQTPAAGTGVKVGLIDMGYIFRNYKRLNDGQEAVKKKLLQADQEMKAMQEAIKNKRDLVVKADEGSPERVAHERDLAKLVSDAQAYQAVKQLEIRREQSKLMRDIYVEVTGAVEQYAGYYKYSLILRFSRDPIVADMKPDETIQRMSQKNVIYFRPGDDISQAVLNYLNKRYQPSVAGGSAPKN